MRIIAGQWRGRPLLAPKGEATRPTSDRTREALFSMLTSRLGSFEGLAVADLFAGSGALGIEALSRGAGSCMFVEHDKAALDALKANLAKLGAKADVRATSVMALGIAPKPLDLILMDPPYGTGAGIVALDKLGRLGWTGPATWISIETAKDETIDLPGYDIDAERIHGKAKITLLRTAVEVEAEAE
jgi:16S rRNA (guanine966-N2)-methyltransferase